MIMITAPLVIAPDVISEPGGTTIEVVQGQDFILRFRLEWDRPGAEELGYFVLGVTWNSPGESGTPSENFTFLSAEAYFDLDGDDLPDDLGSYITVEDALSVGVVAGDARYTAVVSHTIGDERDGEFNVDLKFSAAGIGGVPHIPTASHPMSIVGTIDVFEGEVTYSYSPPDPTITIIVTPWTGGVVVEGKDTAYNSDAAGIPPFVFYDPGDRPLIMVAQEVGDGAFVAAGVVGTCRNGRWNDNEPVTPAPYLDVLFDKAFQWMVPGAVDVLWYEGYGVYNDTVGCSDLVDALTTLGYTVTGDSTEPISAIDLSAYDILILPQLQLGYGPAGGDSDLLPAADVTAIVSFVTDGKGLLIMDGCDHFGYNYNKVHNKILEALGSDWWFQHDEVLDETNSWYGNYSPVCDVDPTTAIGSAYKAVTGTEDIGLYSICSLAPVPTFDVDVSISPAVNSAGAGEEVTFVATVKNTGDAWDTYTLDLSDDLGWPELSFLPNIATLAIYPTDDTHVCENLPDGTADNGVDYNMYVGWEANPYATEGWKTRAYLRFDISSSPPVISATLNAKVRYGPGAGYPTYADDNMLVDVKAVSGDAWLENELTWNTAPAVGSTLDTTMIYDTTTAGAEVWYSWDVTSFVTSELAGDGVVSLCMLSEEKEAAEIDCTVWFYTKDQNGTSDDSPYIEVTYIGPWTTTTVTLGPDESATFDIGVIIDPASSYCTRDTLTIEATSAYTETVVGSGTATAHSKGVPTIVRSVEVEIENDYQEAVLIIDRDAYRKRYDPITFKVIVRNTGELPDKYMLTATDGEGWMLELTPTELYIEPGKFDIAALSVSVPEDAVGCFEKNITVDAAGTLAAGTVDDPSDVGDFATCTVHVEEAACVRIDVLPLQTQTGTPGSKIKWIVRVKNLGNVFNTWSLKIDQRVYDVNKEYPDATITIEPATIELPLCNLGQAILDLEIPEGLETSVRIEVTVTATSENESWPDCVDSATVEVHVVRSIPKIPQGVIKLTVETEIIAIQVWPTSWDFGILDEAEPANTTGGTFTVRNIGNKAVDVTITGSDAKSAPGEPIATWELSDLGDIGLDRYVMRFGPPSTVLTKTGVQLVSGLVPSQEHGFDLAIQAPGAITVPARMWTIVTLTAVEAGP